MLIHISMMERIVFATFGFIAGGLFATVFWFIGAFRWKVYRRTRGE